MDCTGCIHKKICELWVSAEGQDASCYDDTCKETVADILDDDYDLDRLRELVEADRDGRCVVCPKDYDGTLFRIWKNKIVSSERFAWIMKELGKTMFPSREAAEAALKGEQDGEVH